MGGFGSGRWQISKDTTDASLALDVRWLQSEGVLTPWREFNCTWKRNGEASGFIHGRTEVDRVILSYKHRRGGSEWQPVEYPVYLDRTTCNFGGHRTWFLCPEPDCGRRVAKLFLGARGIFFCRHCYHLVYACQREDEIDRAARRADRIRARLGWKLGIFNPKDGKPKGMHWRTFERLEAEHDAFVWRWHTKLAEHFKLLERQFDDLRDYTPRQ